MHDILSIILTKNFFLGAFTAFVLLLIRNNIKAFFRKRKYKANDLTLPENQIKFINNVTLCQRPLMNKEEVQIFYAIEKHLKFKDERVMAQVSLGEFIKTGQKCHKYRTYPCITCEKNHKAYSSFNSKRVDFLIIDSHGMPKVAIEYQGSGHYKGNAAERDMVKKLCYEKANIHLLEIQEHFYPPFEDDSLKAAIDRLLKTKNFEHVFLETRTRGGDWRKKQSA